MASSDFIKTNKAAYEKLSPARKKQFRELLKQIKAEAERNPLVAYQPHPKQRAFHEGTQKIRGFVAGNRAGKTTAGAVDDLVQVLSPELVPKHLQPYKKYGWDEPAKIRVITPDLTRTMNAVVSKFRALTPREAIVGGEWRKAFNKNERILEFENGSVIDFMSTEQDPDKFGGVDLHRAHYDEEPSGPNAETIWQETWWRLYDHGGDVTLTMSPLFGYAVAYDKVYYPWEQGDREILVVQAAVYDNPHMPRKQIEADAASMSKEEQEARIYGRFVHFGGLFYSEFTKELHVRPTPSPEQVRDWDVVVGIDPGVQTGVVWLGFDGDNRCFAFDEHYPKDGLVSDIAAEIKRKNEQWGVSPSYVIDPAGRIRTGPHQEQFATEYARNEIYCAEGQNARGPGILEVKRRLQKGALFVARDCRNLIWEFGRYRKDPNAADEWAAVKKDDHLLDALRYAVMSKTWVIPKIRPTRETNNFNPKFEPPWRGPVPQDNPPLGVFS